ncbi:phosphate-starvation-inducible PsiE family protein [Pseudorhodoplanes sp.]|uniref:phosphate-starvation-inducible PsiE family protein n=1 Tax=Pseudorhodoplanes sp. TaxID=1934341 RepID=UPI00391C4CE7
MKFLEHLDIKTTQWEVASAYEKFEQVVVLILTGLIIVVIAIAVWHLTIKILFSLVLTSFDPTEPGVFQTVFGMIFTVIIALEFKHSILIMVKRHESIVQVRTVVLIAMLAVIRKFIIIDLSSTTANQMFALAAGVLALGAVYWLVRDQDRKTEIAERERQVK